MEFVQFHPTGMVWPPGVVGLLVTEAVRGEGGILRNAEGERFMERYDPKRLELSTRDVVARAIYTEVKERRGTPHGGVFLDVSHLPARRPCTRKLPSMYDQFMELAGVDITREPMEVGPTCHYFMGGIRVDAETGRERGRGPLRRAASARAGMNGANRLGGNSLSDLLVFGKRTGDAAAEYATQRAGAADRRRRDRGRRRRADALPDRARRRRPVRLHAELQATMQEDVGIFRDEAGLTAAVGGSTSWSGVPRRRRAASSTSARFNPGWHLCRDLRNMLDRAPRRSPAPRCCGTRVRGAHSRLDFPELRRRSGATHNIVVRKDADGHAGRDRGRSPRSRRARRRSSSAQGGGAGMSTRTFAALARRRGGRRARRLRGRGRSGHGGPRRGARDPARRKRRTSRSAGTARRPSAARAAPRSTAGPG